MCVAFDSPSGHPGFEHNLSRDRIGSSLFGSAREANASQPAGGSCGGVAFVLKLDGKACCRGQPASKAASFRRHLALTAIGMQRKADNEAHEFFFGDQAAKEVFFQGRFLPGCRTVRGLARIRSRSQTAMPIRRRP